MIGNALDKTLDSIGCSVCHDSSDANDNTTTLESLVRTCNVTGIEENCESLKVEMAVTLAFLTGIIMVWYYQYTLSINFVGSDSMHYMCAYIHVTISVRNEAHSF